jgi:pimeloyl-ACP methyl ester carboxylesterase
VGHSWGTFLGVEVVSRHPDLFDLYVGVGQLAYLGAKNREVQRRFIEEQARLHGDGEALAALARPEGSLEDYLFRYGAEVHAERSWWPMLGRGLRAAEYTLADIVRLTRGLSLYARSPLMDPQPDPIEVVTRLQIPVAFFTGRYDQTDPAELTQAYFDRLEAPAKRMVWFERSAHFPFLEEPELFAQEMQREVDRLLSKPAGGPINGREGRPGER